jgi:hypothetical protein
MPDERGASALINLVPGLPGVVLESGDGLIDERVVLGHPIPGVWLRPLAN